MQFSKPEMFYIFFLKFDFVPAMSVVIIRTHIEQYAILPFECWMKFTDKYLNRTSTQNKDADPMMGDDVIVHDVKGGYYNRMSLM
jgi:hypothetical protein